jgi:hypothetical protein
MTENFFDLYFKYVWITECPTIYHRWTALSVLASTIGRNITIPMGHINMIPNFYLLLTGVPGTKKSTAISLGKKLLKASGYRKFAPDQLSKERFLYDLAETANQQPIDLATLDLSNASDSLPACEITIANGEFLDFIGQGNMDFLTLLTNLWDGGDSYAHSKLSKDSVFINKPTVNLLGGATIKGIVQAIPPEALGTGFLSRMVLIYGEMTDTKISFPKAPCPSAFLHASSFLKKVADLKGIVSYTKEAAELLDKAYKTYKPIPDGRFADYTNRRYTHLLKICTLIAASNLRTEIQTHDVTLANTILLNAEIGMPEAIGELGSSRYAPQIHVIMSALKSIGRKVTPQELWEYTAAEIPLYTEFLELLQNLANSRRILQHGGLYSYIMESKRVFSKDLMDFSLLPPSEVIKCSYKDY